MNLFRSIAFLAALAAASPAVAQWQVPDHAIPVGRGGGATGFRNVQPGSAGLPVVSNGPTSDPTMRPVPNNGIQPGAANTIKGTVDGVATSDLVVTSCTLAYQLTRWVNGAGWQCGALPVLPSRASALTLDLSAFTGISVQGYTTPGDGGAMNMVKVGSQPFCANFTNTAAFQDAAGNWFNIAEPHAYSVSQFGAKLDYVNNTGTDDTTAVQSALNCAGLSAPGSNVIANGSSGRTVKVPAGVSLISSTLTVPSGVAVVGSGTLSSTFVMSSLFPVNQHFVILGDQFLNNDIALSQSGAAGLLTLNGARVRSGVAYTLASRGPQVCSVADNSGVTFTFTGVNAATNATDTEALTGPTAGNCVTSTKGWLQISRIEANGAYTTVTAGYPQVSAFGSRLESLQLFSANINATKFTTGVNCCNGTSLSGVTGASLATMVYSNSTQHSGGLNNVKIVSGNRSAAAMEFGVGGASYVTMDGIEYNNNGSAAGVASVNPGIYLDYGGGFLLMRNLVGASCGASCAPSTGVQIWSGFITIAGSHIENTDVGFDINTTGNGLTAIQNSVGGPYGTDVVKIQSGATSNQTYMQGIVRGGSTNVLNDKGVLYTTPIVLWTLK